MRLRRLIKTYLRRNGYDLHRITRNCGEKDAFAEQKVLLAGEKSRVILDVGANIGQTALKYRTLFPESLIYSFEPFPESFARLASQFAGDGRVRPVQQAVGDSEGRETFYLNESHYTNSLLPCIKQENLEPVGVMEVSTTTIDEFCEREGIGEVQVLKMDIQGGELMALKGAAQRLKKKSIALIYTEVMFSPQYEGQAFFHDICMFLYDHGYSLFDQYNFSHTAEGQIAWGDAIFVAPQIAARSTGRLRYPVLS
jgi:FkbM family methyltransferase